MPYDPQRLAAAATVILGTAAQGAQPVVDTSNWKCEQCPFFQGYDAEAEAGALYASGANASYGRYTGIDANKAYADASAAGLWRRGDGTYVHYDLESLGLPSREGKIEAGQEGHYDFKLTYDGQPTRLYDTGVTPFQGAGGSLALPANWVPAGSTSGMSALSASLWPAKIEYDRRTASLLGRYSASRWTFYTELRHQEKDGTDLISASFLTQAMQLPQPIDYVTNSIEAGLTWAGPAANIRVSYSGSWFTDNNDSLTFSNPYLPIVAGSTEGRVALPPSNNLQQLSATGQWQLPRQATTLTLKAGFGRLRQDDAFLPISTLPGAPALAPGSLNGDVHLSNYALGLSSGPLSKLHLRGTASYDGRDDRTTPIAVPYVVTDSLPGGTVVTPRYGQDRLRLDGSIDYTLLRWIKVGAGGEYKETHYGPGQVLTHLQDAESWGRATMSPLASLSFTLKGGNGHRKTSPYDSSVAPVNENPLVRPFNYATRDRVFYALTGSWSVTPTLTWTVEGFFANNEYPLSPLGVQDARERRGSTTLTWAPSARQSAYVDGSYQRLYARQSGYTGPGAAPWQVANTERFWTVGAGGQWALGPRWAVALDYLHAPSYGDNDVLVASGVAQSFPPNWTKLDLVRLDLRYRWTPTVQMHLRYVHESYNSNDWALDQVEPATIPNVLSLGLQPYEHNVNVVALTVRAQFRTASPTRE